MLFSSMTFVFIFLPVVCLLYLITKKNLHNSILLLASIIFYAWGEPTYLAIMFMTILVNYFGAIAIEKHENKKKLIVILTVITDLGFLVYFKYFNFIVENINAVISSKIPTVNVIMPIGISFYTFQAMSYLIDVYRKDVPAQKDIYKLSLYITLFSQLVAGPIVKYHDIDKEIDSREVTFANVSYGVKRFIIGLAKKMLIANTLGGVADKVFNESVSGMNTAIVWLGIITYSLQLFYDFSGYSDMAIGLGKIFGFNFMENFNYPYISKSITEFWRRWHISLSTWFKEYLYIPLGGNRVSKGRNYLNLFIVFLATGIWHGAEWTFVFWGLWHGIFIIFEKYTGWHKEKQGIILPFIQHIYAIFAFGLGWVFFRAPDIKYAFAYIGTMFGIGSAKTPLYETGYYIGEIEIIALLAGVICAVPLFSKILDVPYRYKWTRALINFYLFILFILSTMAMAGETYNPFIYFRF